jgi:hypothetical protein
MIRSRTLIPAAVLIAGVLACQGEPASRDTTPRVVFKPSQTTALANADQGMPMGPNGAAPEVVLLGDPAPETRAEDRTVKRPEPGPTVIYRTVYIEAPAEATTEPEKLGDPIPEIVDEPIVEPAATPVVPDPEPADAPDVAETPNTPDPVATAPPTVTPTTFPSGGSNRAEDAIVGAAVGASIGAIFGGRGGAVAGGIGGAIGGATSGRGGGILGGIIGASSRGRLPRRGGGC